MPESEKQSADSDGNSTDFNRLTSGDSPWELEAYPDSYVYSANFNADVTTHIQIIPLYPAQGAFADDDYPDYAIEMYTSDHGTHLEVGTRDTPEAALAYVEDLAEIVESIATA